MCGIFAIATNEPVAAMLMQGLYRLEYRGYDSAGFCILHKKKLHIEKKEGRIAELESTLSYDTLPGTLGIAHTRWATHGAPTTQNAHPHLSNNKKFALVHNGIIENHAVLRRLLEKEGYVFHSQTDSEVLVHLIEKFYEEDLLEAVRQALDLVEGTFGIAVLSSEAEEIIAARRGSPLVIGIGKKAMLVASDVAPVLSFTKQVLYLEDNDIVRITPSSYELFDLRGNSISRNHEEISWKLDQIEKGGFAHFMLKEIFEQPDSLRNRLFGRMRDGKLHLSVDIGSPKRIVLVACGTSWHSALIGKHLIERICRIPCEVDYASEFRYRNPVISSSDLVLVISQSGETADTLQALRIAKKHGAKTLGIVNVVGSTIAREVDSGVYLHAGPEIGVASTKAFTSQVLALTLLALYIKQERGGELDPSFLQDVFSLPDKVELALELSPDIAILADEFTDDHNFLYLGRGYNFPVALEGALKLKEISYIHAEGYPAAEMKHGPIALIDANMPVFFIATKDATYEKVLSNMQEVKARGGRVIALVSEVDAEIERLADYVIVVPAVREELSPIINAIPLQLFSYHVAAKRGLDVDKPRNLAKSVTVE